MRRFAVLVALALLPSFAAAQGAGVERPDPSIVDRLLAGPREGEVGVAVAAIDEALGRWEVERADQLATALVAGHQGEPLALLAAARVKFYASEYEAARELAAKAAEGKARDAGTAADAAQLVLWLDERAPTWRSFSERRRGLYVVRTTKRDDLLADYALDALESATAAMTEEMGFVPTEPVVVEIYPSRRSFIAASTLSREEVETSGTLAICHFNRLMILSPGVLGRGYDWLDALCHEYVHLAVYKQSRNSVPVWLHEGIAKTLESRWRSAEPEALDPRLSSVLAEGLETGRWVTFEQMHPSMAKLPSAALVSMAFAEVTTTVRMMRAERGASAVKDVIAALRGNDGDLEGALRTAWGMGLADLEAKAKAHAERADLLRVPGLSVFDGDAHPPALDFQDEGAKEADPEADARKLEDRKAQDFTILGDRLKGRKFHEAALVEYDKALARTGHGDPIVTNKKALVLVLVGRAAEALPLLEESLRYNPALAVTLDNLAEVHVRLAQAAKDPTVSDAEYRKALDMAMQSERVNPFSTDTHLRLASLHDRLGQPDEAKRSRERLAALRAR